jgi:hypothetical protein
MALLSFPVTFPSKFKSVHIYPAFRYKPSTAQTRAPHQPASFNTVCSKDVHLREMQGVSIRLCSA